MRVITTSCIVEEIPSSLGRQSWREVQSTSSECKCARQREWATGVARSMLTGQSQVGGARWAGLLTLCLPFCEVSSLGIVVLGILFLSFVPPPTVHLSHTEFLWHSTRRNVHIELSSDRLEASHYKGSSGNQWASFAGITFAHFPSSCYLLLSYMHASHPVILHNTYTFVSSVIGASVPGLHCT